MLNELILKKNNPVALYLQIADAVKQQIDAGLLEKECHMPSINDFSRKFLISRDTVERAYKYLKKRELLKSVPGIGYFVIEAKPEKIKILLVFDKLSSFKKMIYDEFLNTLGDNASVDLKIHHCKPLVLKEIIETDINNYNYCVIMPHFETKCSIKAYMSVIASVPEHKLLLLDKGLPQLKNVMGVFQDFNSDIYNALVFLKDSLKKYNRIVMIFPSSSNHPVEIIEGVKKFGKLFNKTVEILSNTAQIILQKKQVFIIIEDDDLAKAIKLMRNSKFKIGKDVGVISFNETPLKDILDITVISTDFKQMGMSAASLILNSQYTQVKNPFNVHLRSSL